MAPSFLAWVDQHDLALAPAFLLSIFCPSELPHLILLHLQALAHTILSPAMLTPSSGALPTCL